MEIKLSLKPMKYHWDQLAPHTVFFHNPQPCNHNHIDHNDNDEEIETIFYRVSHLLVPTFDFNFWLFWWSYQKSYIYNFNPNGVTSILPPWSLQNSKNWVEPFYSSWGGGPVFYFFYFLSFFFNMWKNYSIFRIL